MSQIRNRIRLGWIPVLAVVGALLGPVSSQAQTCGNYTLSGNYVWKLSGNFYYEDGSNGYFQAVLNISADGKGNISGTEFYNDDGGGGGIMPGSGSVSGTYTVNSDCTLTINLLQADPGYNPNGQTATTFSGAIGPSGKNGETVETDDYYSVTGGPFAQSS